MFMKHIDQALTSPVATPLQKRNTLADWAFYDVSDLTEPEFNWLAAQPIKEGTILIVEPAGGADDIRIEKFEDHAQMLDAPGSMIEHFAIAGVGSSDVGAAALARTLANHLDAPVGAIVSGYGMADILQEALFGWFFFGAANRAQAVFDRYNAFFTGKAKADFAADERERAATIASTANDTRTLLRVLRDEGRQVKTLLGHSKGCLSIAFAFNELQDMGDPKALEPYSEIEVITAGAVVELPEALTRVRQYLGGIDWFGGLNSIPGIDHITVPNAWHHLNTEMAFHMDLAEVLQGRYD